MDIIFDTVSLIPITDPVTPKEAKRVGTRNNQITTNTELSHHVFCITKAVLVISISQSTSRWRSRLSISLEMSKYVIVQLFIILFREQKFKMLDHMWSKKEVQSSAGCKVSR